MDTPLPLVAGTSVLTLFEGSASLWPGSKKEPRPTSTPIISTWIHPSPWPAPCSRLAFGLVRLRRLLPSLPSHPVRPKMHTTFTAHREPRRVSRRLPGQITLPEGQLGTDIRALPVRPHYLTAGAWEGRALGHRGTTFPSEQHGQGYSLKMWEWCPERCCRAFWDL